MPFADPKGWIGAIRPGVPPGNATPLRPSASSCQTRIRIHEFTDLFGRPFGLVPPPPAPVNAEDFFSIFLELMYSSSWCQAICCGAHFVRNEGKVALASVIDDAANGIVHKRSQ